MAREGGTQRFTRAEIDKKRSDGEDRTDWDRFDAPAEDEIERAVAEDADDPGYPEDWPRGVVPGIPEAKEKVSLRLDADVVRWFRAGGPRYQTRINSVLRAYMKAHASDRQA